MKLNSNSERQDVLRGLESIDWSFPSVTNSGLHSIHWYPATYIAAIPGSIIPYVTSVGDLVLDPFCGSGTTGVEALRLGRRFVGMDTNPVAILISEAKLRFVSPARLLNSLDDILRGSKSVFSNEGLAPHPNEKILLQWYHPETMSELNSILLVILAIKERILRRTLLAVFSSILKNCSSQGRHWGWVCDNVKPKTQEISYKDARIAFSNALIAFADASQNAFSECKDHSMGLTREELRKRAQLIQGSCVEQLARMEADSIDAIVTSPPYYGVADYVKSQRLTYLWFDVDILAKDRLGFRDFEKLRANEAGARSNRHRTNSHSLYLDFMDDFFASSSRVLKWSGLMCLVVGESASRAGTTELLIELAAKNSLHLQSRVARDIKNNRRRLMAKVKGEDLLFFSKI